MRNVHGRLPKRRKFKDATMYALFPSSLRRYLVKEESGLSEVLTYTLMMSMNIIYF
jgi:hypothetical protein